MFSVRHFILIAALALPFGTMRALDWNELNDGDLSGDGNAPTFILFTEGDNLIEGTMGALGGVGPVDADVWTFTIAAGYYLTGINLVSYSAPTSGNQSFMAIDDASTINMSDPSQHLSNGLWTEELDGFGNTYTNLLAILDAGPEFGGTGFDGPLGPGTYTFWIQEGSEQIQYCIDFVVTPVPEPGSVLLLGLAGMLAWRRRR
ncbi:PEP-CTERM sorting domain-containing protein [Prosthecobacter sp.]|uniref:PEP-CTERM sorting domain-containing protein n=1 Tax=Prosthecobacter sp. TaxID=1965333 RepID=UPI001DC9ACAE|nr:PEP-CTERM sorting domain-containing protein [Prosthecobacter sp.]MCB1276718.1 PEP-CTERM sorting domain-containing protein [Prosthecobacter sp.]